MSVIITFDVGTTSTKCIAFNENFEPVTSITQEYELNSHDNVYVEADPEIYWDSMCRSFRAVLSDGIDPKDILSIGITTQGETTIVTDADNIPLMPAIVWLDERAGAQAEELNGYFDMKDFYSTTGLPAITGALPLAKLKWIMESPAANRVARLYLLEDWLINKLTGAFVTEGSLICSTGYYDIMQHKYYEDAINAAGASIDILPEVIPCGTIAGTTSEKAAQAAGLVPGIPVVATAMDQTCSAIGAGNIKPGIVSETTGTCLTIVASIKKPEFDISHPVQYYTHFDNTYLALSYNPTAAIDIKWFKDNFIKDSTDYHADGGNVYQYMSRLAADAPVGSDGVMFIPHLTGKAMPNPVSEMRGMYAGINLGTEKKHMIRAIMEGVGFMLRENLDCLASSGIEFSRIYSLGGGAKDRVWCQIKSDITGYDILVPENEESTSLGAAILSYHAVFANRSVEDICTKAIRIKRSFTPDPSDHDTYLALYEKYLALDKLCSQF